MRTPSLTRSHLLLAVLVPGVLMLLGALAVQAKAGSRAESPIDRAELPVQQAPSATPTSAPATAITDRSSETPETLEAMKQDPNYEEKMARASATPDYSRAVDPALAPPPPDFPPFVGIDGFIRILGYDDRDAISQAERDANPIQRPGAPEIVACLAQIGLSLDREEPVGLISDADISHLVAIVNQDGPFLAPDRQALRYEAKGQSDPFLECAQQHLTQ